jgi:G3E family GTPase
MASSKGRIPVSVLTGFLGSGKTTVLNCLVRHPRMARALVIINEFGEIGLDHELVESATDDMVLLQSGCVCCTIRSDLIDALEAMLRKAEQEEMPRFDRVVIETTGLADPAPILQGFISDPWMAQNFVLDGVIATVDAVTGDGTLDRHIEAVKQAAVADRLLLTKTDLAESSQSASVERRLRLLNPAAPIVRTIPGGEIDPDLLFGAGLFDPSAKSADIQRWLDEEKYLEAGAHEHEAHAGHAHHGGTHQHGDVNRHDEHIRAICLVFDDPIPSEVLDRWLASLFRFRGPDLLRFKAIVNVQELPGPLILHGVQHVIHPPMALKSWPGEDRRTRMVFITYDIDENALRASFQQNLEVPA